MPSRVSHPLTDVAGKMRTPIEWDDANVVDHLDEDHYVSGSLQDLIVVVVCARKHGRPCGGPQDAPLGQTAVLRTSCGTLQNRGTCRGGLLSLWRQSRNSAVRGINDDRSSPGRYNFGSPVPPGVVISAAYVGFGRSVAAIFIGFIEHALFIFRCFGCREKLLAGKLLWTFE